MVIAILSYCIAIFSFVSTSFLHHGSTKPVVPSTDIPPLTPALSFPVFLATSFPPGTEILTPPLKSNSLQALTKFSRIWDFAELLTAFFPALTPMPSPKNTPRVLQTSASKTIPFVTSNSWSPENFFTLAKPSSASTPPQHSALQEWKLPPFPLLPSVKLSQPQLRQKLLSPSLSPSSGTHPP